jgi:molecular chaperone DnaK (HSP70)
MPPSTTDGFSSADLIIAIDFGTTFTGVAYFYSGATAEVPRDEINARKIASDVNVIKEWPNVSQQYTEKIPTIIAYNDNPPTWGGSVRPHHEPQVGRFKLGLEPTVPTHYGYDADPNSPTVYGKHPDLPGKEAVDFTTDYLRCVHTYVQEKFLPKQFGPQFLRNQRISYVITVPAIWKDSAKALTRQAASSALGISNDELILIPEPEAAALFCATTCQEVGLNDGDQFLLCDAGGGTVVSFSNFQNI